MRIHQDVIVGDDVKNFQKISSEELISQRKNSWKGWRCAAGTDHIHITADGNIFSATCRVGGLLGNVFDTGIKFPKTWLICDKEWCMCGDDIKITKIKDVKKDQLTLEKAYFKQQVDEVQDPTIVGNSHFERLTHFPKNISWDIGRRCNFSCSYCPPSTANNFESHKSWGTLKHATDSILVEFCTGKRAKWIFTGGEPTVNPHFLELMKYLSSRHQIAHTQTNGSRTPEYYQELIGFGSIGFSVHFEEADLDRLIETSKLIIERKKNDPIAHRHWTGMRLMVAPGSFSKAMEFYNRLILVPEFTDFFHVNMSTVYKKENGSELMNYDPEEMKKILEYS